MEMTGKRKVIGMVKIGDIWRNAVMINYDHIENHGHVWVAYMDNRSGTGIRTRLLAPINGDTDEVNVYLFDDQNRIINK